MVVEDDEGIRENLEFFLKEETGVECVGSFAGAEEALSQISVAKPEVILMDIHLPGMSGIECVRRISASHPAIQVIMLTVHDDSEQIFQSLLAGAKGYFLKRTPCKQIMLGIREVLAGGSPMNSEIARKVIQMTVNTSTKKSPINSGLTDREKEVLDLLAQGYLYKEIAGQLEISVDTVSNHIRKIYEKLQVHNRTEAVVKYLNP